MRFKCHTGKPSLDNLGLSQLVEEQTLFAALSNVLVSWRLPEVRRAWGQPRLPTPALICVRPNSFH